MTASETASDPQAVHRLFLARFLAGDVDGLVSLFEPTGTFVPEPGKPVSGHAAIHEALAGFLALKPAFTMESRLLAHTDDVAQLASIWTLTARLPDGNALDLAGIGTEIVRKQADGRWLLVIDNPWGVSGI